MLSGALLGQTFKIIMACLWFIVSSCVVICCVLCSHFRFVFAVTFKKIWYCEYSIALPALQMIAPTLANNACTLLMQVWIKDPQNVTLEWLLLYST